MRNRIQIALVLGGLLLLSGCGLGGVYEMKGESFLSLDRAMALATTTDDLWNLWEKAPTQEKIVVEEEILKAILQGNRYYPYGKPREGLLQNLRSRASSEEIRNTATDALHEQEQAEKEGERRREEQRAQAQKSAEEFHLARKEAMKRLIQEAGGRLDDKSVEEVNRLVGRWRAIGPLNSWGWDVRDTPLELQELLRRDLSDKLKQLPATNNFYKAFGQPQRKQLISRPVAGIFGLVDHAYYYFYYQCRDGTVQMEVDANSLDEEGCIQVSDLNIL